jgi:fluoroquinolone transport system permease protein
MAIYPLVIAVVVRLGVSPLTEWLVRRYEFNLAPYYPLLMSVILLMPPMLAGIVIGFLLLDQRDDQTMAALQVTPLTLKGYFAYRNILPLVLSFIVTVIVFVLAGLVSVGFLGVIGAAASSAPLAPIYALALATLAANKVQGFAFSKAFGVLLFPPVFAYFFEPPVQFIFGLDPLYWPARFFWSIHAGEQMAWLYLLIGFGYQVLLIRILSRRLYR